MVGRILKVQRRHRVVVGQYSGFVVDRGRSAIKDAERPDIIFFAFASGADQPRFLNGGGAFLELPGRRRSPQRMIVAHRDAPLRDTASWVGGRSCEKLLFGALIFEGMQPLDALYE